ncbi:hypothetical protein [Teredinibacter turnerae]|uniref:hypothetical protein n=1 Tax=Teredinibacter turnerae TaxID=2426 RepID=UPI0012BC78C4|nr:hypothetical protein [Teredinibacter turnerae]
MTVKKVVLGFIGTFFPLSVLATQLPGIMVLIVFAIPAFVLLLSQCRCEGCREGYGIFLQNLDLRTGKCLSCSQKTKKQSGVEKQK